MLGRTPGDERARRAAVPARAAPAHRPDAAAAVPRSPPPGRRRARVGARHPADHGGGALPGVPADPLLTGRRAGVDDPAVAADRRVAAGRIGGRRHGPAPPADGGAGAAGRLQRRAGGQHRPGTRAVAVVRAAGAWRPGSARWTTPGATPSCRVWSAGPRCPPRAPCSRSCSSWAWWSARPGRAAAGGAGVRFVYWMDVASFGVARAAVFLISPQPAGARRPPARPALDPRGPPVRPRQAAHPGGLPDRHQRDGVRHAAGAVPGPGHTCFGGAPAHARLPLRRARRGRPGRRAHHRLGQPHPAPGPGGHRRRHRLGRRDHLRSGWCRGCPPHWRCSPPRAAPTSSRRCSAARSSSSPCRTRCAGRLAGLQIAVVTGGPRLGDLESGAVAAGFGDTVSVVSGGLACIAGALPLARLLPGFRQQRASASHHAPVSSPVESAEGEPRPGRWHRRSRLY